MQKDKQFYDEFYAKYPASVHDNFTRFTVVADLLQGKCLDVACGTGTLSKYYNGDYTGVDFSDNAIRTARNVRRKNAWFVVGDFTDVNFISTKKFDSAYLGEFLEHIENDEVVFENVLKVVKIYGRIVVSVPNGDRVPDESHCRTFTVASIRRDYSKYGKITFHDWAGFFERIIFSIELGSPDFNEISLVMIVKDEEKGIEKSITSALPFVDRVVVSVDSKTRDKTKEIAEMYADELRVHEWQNDFSQARNEASQNVKSRWILFLDGHEFIESFGDIEEKMKSDVDGIFVTVRMETGMTFLYPRIYRTGLQFKNAVHNSIECKTKRGCPNFVIVHDRLSLQDEEAIKRRNAQRNEMMPVFLRKQIKENKRNPRAHFHLANFLSMQNDHSGAIRHFKKCIKYSQSEDQIFMSLVCKAQLHMSQGQTFRAYWTLSDILRLNSERWETHRLFGSFWFTQEKWKDSVESLVQSLEPNKRRYAYEPLKRDLSETWNLIGHCFLKLDQPAQSIIAWNRSRELAVTEELKKYYGEKIKFAKMLLPNFSNASKKILVKDEEKKA